MSVKKRHVFFISDGTGITAEALGHSLLTQFEGMQFILTTFPFINSSAKAMECVTRINATNENEIRPLIFSTLVDPEISSVIKLANGLYIDFFEAFISPLEVELGQLATHTMGRTHGVSNKHKYDDRMEAINFALSHDDGLSNESLNEADVILIGVSRTGKTPTSLYLALQFGIKAANYPLIPEDFERMSLPKALPKHRNKLFGLTIAPERLQQIRHERRPNSQYASIANCQYEIEKAAELMRREKIRWLDSTVKSIEEIATTIMQEMKLERRVY